MKRHLVLMTLLIPACINVRAGDEDKPPLALRGQPQTIVQLQASNDAGRQHPAILFLPGDGGWRGAAVSMAQAMAGWGYPVFGFDTKSYLEGFTRNGSTIRQAEMAADLETAGRWVAKRTGRPCVFVGWSQGAGMGVLALSSSEGRQAFRGLVTIGLPESAVLGWSWKDTLAVVAHREPDEPHFATAPLLGSISPAPLWMIHASGDEYTGAATARRLFAAAREPKQYREVDGGNHRFDGRREEFLKNLREGLEWVSAQSR